MTDAETEHENTLQYVRALCEVIHKRNANPNPQDEFDIDPAIQVSDETIDAMVDLTRTRAEYFHVPWKPLDALLGGMPGGEVCVVCAFSSQGKTLLLTSLMDHTFEQTKKKTYYMGLESKPKTLRTHWACKRLGFDAGDLFSGKFLDWPDYREVRALVDAEIKSQNFGDKYERVRFCPSPYITAKTLYRAADQAREFEADLFIIDHIDHIAGSGGGSDYTKSVEVSRAILDIAQSYGFLMIPSSQLNNDAVRGNRIALHLPPQPQYVKFGGHKREMATWMIACYRPLLLAGVDSALLRAVNNGEKPATTILEPDTMAVVIMKHRFYGSREWLRCYLRVDKGKVVSFTYPNGEEFSPLGRNDG